MAITARLLQSKQRNGVGAFILQCKRLTFSYCDWGGSSRGMLAFLRSPNGFRQTARQHPQVEMVVQRRKGRHPLLLGEYINGRQKAVCVRNLEANQIADKAQLLCDASGRKLKRHRAVESMNTSVRGIWSPFHQPAHRI